MKARKKPVIVECIQWTGDNLQEIRDFVGDYLFELKTQTINLKKQEVKERTTGIKIKTLEGNHLCNIGDYIIKGVQGEFYPCKPDIFKETYEVLDYE